MQEPIVVATGWNHDHVALLYHAVEDRGITVWRRSLSETLRLPWPRGRKIVVHVHWIDHCVQSKSLIRSLLTTVRLLGLLGGLRLRGARIVWTVHNWHAHDGHHPRLERFVQRAVVGLSTAVTVTTEDSIQRLRAQFGDAAAAKGRVVPLPTMEAAYPVQAGRRASREQLALPPDDVVLLFFGTIRPYKGVLELVDTFEACDLPATHLVIAGSVWDHALGNELLFAAAGRADITLVLGHQSADAIATLVTAADWIVLPYLSGTNSGVLALAIGFGKPVIASDAGTMAEVLDVDGKSAGIMYPREAPGALHDALVRAMSLSARERQELDVRVEELSRRFSQNVVGQKLHAVYREVIGHAS